MMSYIIYTQGGGGGGHNYDFSLLLQFKTAVMQICINVSKSRKINILQCRFSFTTQIVKCSKI